MMNFMQVKKYLFFSIFFTFVGYVLSNARQFGICSLNDPSCRALFDRIGEPILFGGIALSVVFFVLLFTHQYAFSAWKKFAVWYVPIAALIMAFYPTPPGNFIVFSPQPSTVVYYLSLIYVIASVVIIALQFFKQRKIG